MKNLRQNINLNIGFLIVFACTFNSTISSEIHNSSIRLPTSIQPLKYNLHIKSNIHEDNLTFTGNVIIEFVVKESTDEIILHAKELTNFVINLKDARNRRRYENLRYSLQKEKDFLKISIPKMLINGERYRLEINYIGKIQEQFYGFYKTSYLDEYYNRSIPIAVTQFEPTNARLAFPCFDEPSFRATFVITITHGTFYTALSNMPIDGQPRWNDNMITTIFRETPAMPTYLVGFVICNYHFISNIENAIEHRVYFPPNSKDMGIRAITNSIKSVTFLEKYLGIKYPLPKLDHIHVKDADMVAMNWGLAIYNDNDFLTTLEDRDSTVTRIILQNYLISQQWFANMVPLNWWSNAWINSALGTYFSYVITDLMYPSWKIEEYFILNEVDELLKLNFDGPMVSSVDSQESIERVAFDDRGCQMGASILKMFQHAIGNATFTKGLVNYLKFFNLSKNSIADEDDLFKAMQSAIVNDNVYLFQIDKSFFSKIMKTWTHNQGIPIVKVVRHYDNRTVTIQQKSHGSGNTIEKWWIPLNFATASNGDFAGTKADYIMAPATQVSIDMEKDVNVSLMNSDWLILNKQQTGLYYVVYDDQNLELIAKALNEDHTKIHMLNRALLFRDLKAVLETDLGAIKPLLELLKYLKNEQDSMPWYEASELINELWSRLKDGKAYELFKIFISDIIGNFYHHFFDLPLYKLSFADSIIKKSIYKLACEVEVSECLTHALHETRQYLYYNWPIDESSKRFTMCKAMQSAKLEEIKDIFEKILYPSVSLSKEKEFLKSLNCIKSEKNINFIFDFLHEGDMTTRKLAISNYMMFYHATFRKRIEEITKIHQRQDFDFGNDESEETIRKRDEFKRKYEESIYTWLRQYIKRL